MVDNLTQKGFKMTEQEIIEKYDRKLSDLQDKYLDLTNENYAEPTKPMEIANNGENLIYKYSAIVEYIVNKLESKDKEGVGVLIIQYSKLRMLQRRCCIY